MAVPGANVSRDTTVTVVNPTPPTNSPVTYQGSPPTPAGLVPLENIPPPLITDEAIGAFHDPANGAVNGPLVGPDALPPVFDEIAGKAEADGTEDAHEYQPGGRVRAREAGDPYTDGVAVTPNASHPSYGFQTSEGAPEPDAPELIINGDFTLATGWTLNGGASIAAGVLAMDGSGAGQAVQVSSTTLVAGTYNFSFDVLTSDGNDGVKVHVGGTNSPTVPGSTAPGHYTGSITTTATTQNIFISALETACTLDNFSLKAA